MTYTLLHITHMTCAGISITLFVLRGALKIARGEVPDHALFKVAPHAIDTLLLLSALALTLQINQFPFLNGWLTVKFFALVAYIILGSVALKRTRGRAATAAAVAAAALVFAFIVSVAWYHHPLGIGVWLLATSTP